MFDRFHTKDNPMRQLKSHTWKISYYCALCGEGFISWKHINKHGMLGTLHIPMLCVIRNSSLETIWSNTLRFILVRNHNIVRCMAFSVEQSLITPGHLRNIV